MHRSIIILLFLIPFSSLFAQKTVYQFGQWKHTALNGSISLNGLYRNQENILSSGRTEKPVTKYINGEFYLRSKSYIWHPSFIKLDIDLDFNPGVRNESFLVIPNRTETRTAEQIRLNSTFFAQRTLTVNFFSNISHSYINREYTSSVESYRKDFGSGLSFRNKYMPLSLHYLNADWEQTELSTGRAYDTKRENIRFEANNSIYEGNKNQFSYNYEDVTRLYAMSSLVRNYIHAWRLSNRFIFDSDRKNYWNSLFTYRNQKGNQAFERWQIVQEGMIKLPYQFSGGVNYRFSDYLRNTIVNRQHNISGNIEHQLFLSLSSRLFYEYINVQQPSFTDDINRAGISFKYQKKIPTGSIKLGYEFIRRNDHRIADAGVRFIVGENQVLEDSKTIVLENPYANEFSVQVWNETRIILYEENIDYILLSRGDYLEIQRLPGGQIEDGQMVSIDYRVTEVNAHQYNTNLNHFNAGINLFGRLLEGYFRLQDQDYSNIEISSIRILKTVDQQVYGLRLNWQMFSTGWEYDSYKSNVVPYTSSRYFLNYSDTFYRSLQAFISGSWRERKLDMENENQSFADISGRLGYLFHRNTKLSISGGYRFQNGRGIDLNLFNMKLEVQHRIRLVFVSGGIEIYRRDYSGEIIDYQGGFIRVERKF